MLSTARVLAVACLAALGASATIASATSAPEKPFDVRELPRLAGASEQGRSSSDSVKYTVPGSLPDTLAAVQTMLGALGYAPFAEPFDTPSRHSHYFKKGGHAVRVFLTTPNGRTDITGVDYGWNRMWNDIPVPEGTRDIVFDNRRPFMSANAPGTVTALLEFFRAELTATGWSEWSDADAARFPNARIEPTAENGVRAYFTRDKRQDPIQVTLGRRADNRVDIEVKVPAFARPQNLKAETGSSSLLRPDIFKSASQRGGEEAREMRATIPAERDAVLAFYRRELASRNWKEEPQAGSAGTRDIVLNFSSPTEGTIVLKLGYQYDLTIVELSQRLTPAIIAARAKARRDTEEKAARDFEERMRVSLPASEPAQTAANSPLPIPAGASAVTFDGARGELKFDSTSGVPEIAGFYRSNLKKLGWQERPSVISRPDIVALDLARGGKRLYLSITRMGTRTSVRAYGPGLVTTAVATTQPGTTPQASRPAQTTAAPAKAGEPLEAEDYNGFPVPESSTSKQLSRSKFRSELNAKVCSDLATVLAFYRRELARLNWQEEAGSAAVRPDHAAISYSSPDGPASLTLGREGGMTTISVALRKPEEARKAGILPRPGSARIIMGSMIDRQAVVTIDNRAITIGAGVGKDAPNGPTLDLAPGKYRYTLKVPGKPAASEDVTVRADQTWALVVGPGGAIALNLY